MWSDIRAASGSNPIRAKDRRSTSRSPAERAPATQRIFLAEDDSADVFLIREAISGAQIPADIQVVSDGEAAIRFIDQIDADESASGPSLFLLDLNLPKRSGTEVLLHLRQTRRYATAPVIIVTSSTSEEDRKQAFRFAANAYFRKPSSYAAYLKLASLIKSVLAERTETD